MRGLAKFKKQLSKGPVSLDVKKETIRNVVTGSIYQILHQEGKSKSDLAHMMGVSKAAITNLLSGDRNFTIDKLTEISHCLNRTPKICFDLPDRFKRESWSSCFLTEEHNECHREINISSENIVIKESSKSTKRSMKVDIDKWGDSIANVTQIGALHAE